MKQVGLHWERADEKTRRLVELLKEFPSVVVAYSGGCDSSLLAAAAHRALGVRALAVTGLSPLLSHRDREDAQRQAHDHGWNHEFMETEVLDVEGVASNPPDRCYHCKRVLLLKLLELAKQRGLQGVVDGSNLDDLDDYRPGARAKNELRVRSPLQEIGFHKQDVRRAARVLGLATADKAASACLASRFPYGTRLRPDVLATVDRAERALENLGFAAGRVRHHGEVARIELSPEDLPRALKKPVRERIVAALKDCGFAYVTLDLEGYRMGSLNETLA